MAALRYSSSNHPSSHPLHSEQLECTSHFELSKGGSSALFSSTLVSARPYNWPQNGPPSPKNTALVIIDMQNDFCAPGGYLEAQGYDIQLTRGIIPNIKLLLEACRRLGYPVFHTREGHRQDLSTLSPREAHRSRLNDSGLGIGDMGPMGRLLVRGERGWEIIAELQPLPNEPVIDKPGRSAFSHTDFSLLLRNKQIQNLILVGVTTDVCVHSTMRVANDDGMDCLLVKDATMASVKELHEAAVAMVEGEGGIFGATATTSDVLKALETEDA